MRFRIVAPSAGCIRFSPPPLLFYPFLFMLRRPASGRDFLSSVGSPRFSIKQKFFLSGLALVGLPILKKFFVKVFLTGALLLATTPSGAGAADRHRRESAGIVEIGRFVVHWIYARRSDSTRPRSKSETTTGREKTYFSYCIIKF